MSKKMSGGAQSQREVEKGGRKGESSVLGWNGQPSRTIDCYELLEQVGEGTYGQVFMGRDKMTKEVVALKRIRFYSKGQGLHLTALREIKILKQLEHENMVRLKEIVTSVGSKEWKSGANSNMGRTVTEEERRGNIYLVLEYVEHDLAGLLDHQYVFPVPAIKFLVKQLLKVLSHMHEHAYLHRDIKCSNLLIDNNYNLKLADFGLARRLALRSSGEGSSAGDALTNKVITLWYRPPELLLGSRQYGPAVDLWGVGCIMAELLTGRPLFYGRTEVEQVNMIFKVCGTPSEQSWPNHKNLADYEKMAPCCSYDGVLDSHLRTMTKKSHMRMDEHWDYYMSREAIQLIKRLLTLDPRRRCTAAAALSSGWFVTKPACPERATDLSPLDTGGASFHEWKTKKERKEKAILKQKREAAMSTSPSLHSPDTTGSGLQQQHIAPPPPPPPPRPSNLPPVNKPPPYTTSEYHVQTENNHCYLQEHPKSSVTVLPCDAVNQAQAYTALPPLPPPPPPLLSTSTTSSPPQLLSSNNNNCGEGEVQRDDEKTRTLEKRKERLQKWYKQKQLKSSSSSFDHEEEKEEEKDYGGDRKKLPFSSFDEGVQSEGFTQMALKPPPPPLLLYNTLDLNRSSGALSSPLRRRNRNSSNYAGANASSSSVPTVCAYLHTHTHIYIYVCVFIH